MVKRGKIKNKLRDKHHHKISHHIKRKRKIIRATHKVKFFGKINHNEHPKKSIIKPTINIPIKQTSRPYFPEIRLSSRSNHMKKKFNVIFIISFIIIIIIAIVGILLYSYFNSPKAIKYGDNIDNVVNTTEGKEVETLATNTTKPTKPKLKIPGSGGGGGGSSGGGGGEPPASCSPTKTCVNYPLQCGIGLSDGCNNILNCTNNCNSTQNCINSTCVDITGCINDIGCDSSGIFCNENQSYNCSLESDGCFDRQNISICNSLYECINGIGCSEIKECTANSNCSYLNNDCAQGICNLTSSKCQTNFSSSTNTCRGSTGICDIAEKCSGSSATCPADVFNSSSNVCRAASEECDLQEFCSGSSAACPSDSKKPDGTTCTTPGLGALSPFLAFLKFFGIDFGIMETRVCQSGVCTDIRCNNNADCGTDAWVESPVCQGSDVYQNYITFTCNNPGISTSSCSNSTTLQLKQTCTSGCSSGECIIPCSYTSWTNQGCGKNVCPLNQMYQNRTVISGTGCTDTSQCMSNDTCTLVSSAVSWWTMDDIYGNTVIDKLGRNNGTNNGALQTIGIKGKSMSFNGINNFINVGNGLNFNKAISISAWIYTKPASSTSYIMTKWTSFGHNYALDLNNGKIGISLNNITGDRSFYSPSTLSNYIWHNIIATYNSSTRLENIYIDGVMQSEESFSGSLSNSNEPVFIGASGIWTANPDAHNSYFFNGSIDEVMIFNRSLNQAEVNKIYNY